MFIKVQQYLSNLEFNKGSMGYIAQLRTIAKKKALDRLKSMEYKCLDNFEEYIYIFKDFLNFSSTYSQVKQ